MKRAFANILSGTVDRTARFYESLLGMHRHFESDWFVILSHPQMDGLELGILDRATDMIPDAARSVPAGLMLTFVVDDTDAVHSVAVKLGAEIMEKPTDMPYGQRRMLMRDPDGTLVDVSAPTAPRA